jgi:hypothetical protein
VPVVHEVVHQIASGVSEDKAERNEDQERQIEDVVAGGEEAADDGRDGRHDDDGHAAEDQPAAERIDFRRVYLRHGAESLEPELWPAQRLRCGGHGIASGGPPAVHPEPVEVLAAAIVAGGQIL